MDTSPEPLATSPAPHTKMFLPFKTTAPLGAALAASFLYGIYPWLSDDDQRFYFLYRLFIVGCGLWWLLWDAQDRKKSVRWMGWATVLFQPIGFLAWFITNDGKRFYRPFSLYLLCLIATIIIGAIGYVFGGFAHGFSLRPLLVAYLGLADS
jgi:peptidoglycan/LPS O-acetylase OafA/YrhL